MAGGFQVLDWRRRMWTLLSIAFAYTLLTLLAQGLGNTSPQFESAPVEISTDLIASLGLLYAAFRSLREWAHPLVRRSWLRCCAGMFLIWCVEAAIGKFADIDFRIVIIGWTIAPLLLFRSMQGYSTQPCLPKIMWFGLTAQLVAHGAWILEETSFPVSGSEDTLLGLATDTGELVALLSYIVAFVMARHSGLDELVARGDARLKAWAQGSRDSATGAPTRARVCFPFIAQVHQVFHALPIAVALAARHPDVDVHVAGSPEQVARLRELAQRKAGTTRLHFDELYLAWPLRLLQRLGLTLKKLTLRANTHYFAGFDAIVVPERTTTYLRRIYPQIRLIDTEHGAGDRAITFSREMADFDFLLVPGEKQARRLLELGYAKPGHYQAGIYAKLDWAQPGSQGSEKLFQNDRPTVVYNPHFDRSLSSWPQVGRQVLDYFAKSTRYNLIFAPHIRMFDPAKPAKYEAFREYLNLPHMRIDLGSERSADMTYTRAADLYLGDVSSQVVEFVVKPRPCVFLNPSKVQWQDNLHYRCWHLGIVVEDVDGLDAALAASFPLSAEATQRQKDYLRDTLGVVEPGSGGPRGAQAIVDFLRSEALGRRPAQ
jgi:hypothetical protein